MSYEEDVFKAEALRRHRMTAMLKAHIAAKERRKQGSVSPSRETKAKPVRIVELGKETFVEMDNGAVFNRSIYSKHGQLYLQILDNCKAKQTLSMSIDTVQELYNEKI